MAKIPAPILIVSLLLAATSLVRAEPSTEVKVGEFTFTRPEKWESAPVASSMRKAQLKVMDATGKSEAEIAFFQFGSSGAGGVKANVDRWLRQFEEPRDQINAKIEETTVGKTKITFVQAEGTYKSGMPGGTLISMSNFALCGAILESDAGDVFVKMTGPKTLVKASVAEFKQMIESGPKKN